MVRFAALLYLIVLSAPAIAATQPLDLWDVAPRQTVRKEHYKALSTVAPVTVPPSRPAASTPGWGSLAQACLLTVAAALFARGLPRPRRHAVAAAEARPRIR